MTLYIIITRRHLGTGFLGKAYRILQMTYIVYRCSWLILFALIDRVVIGVATPCMITCTNVLANGSD